MNLEQFNSLIKLSIFVAVFFFSFGKSLVKLLILKINQYHQNNKKKLSGFRKPSRLT